MSIYRRYLLALAIAFFCSNMVMAVETVIETDAPPKVKHVSIDMLVAKYHAASDKDAYKIMNQIKQEIARMSRERQNNAIGKVRESVAQKELAEQQKKHPETKMPVKKKKVSKKQKKQIRKQKKQQHKRVKKHKSKVRKVRKHIRHTKKHPDPMSVINGMSEGSGVGTKGKGSTGGHHGGMGGHSGDFGGGMGSMGTGMGGF